MANDNPTQGGFLGNLGKIYRGYTGGFIVFTHILAILEQMGVPNKIIGYCFVIADDRRLRLYRHPVAHDGSVRVLRRRPQGAGVVQRHGHRRRLDERRLVHLDGRRPLSRRLQRPGLRAGLDRRLRAGRASCSRPICASSASSPCPTSSARATRATSPRLCGVIVLFCGSFTYIVAQCFGIGIITSRFLGIGFEVASSSACRHPGVLDAGRHAGGDLDPGGPVHHPDHLLPRAGDLALDAEVRHADPRADLRPGAQTRSPSSSRSSAS